MAAATPNVELTNIPSKYNLAYGVNMFSFYDTNATSPKFALQIRDTSDNLKADLRQFANTAGYAHFDLGNILKNYVDYNPTIEQTTLLETSDYEAFRFKIKYGYENSTGGTTTQGTLPSTASTNDYIVINGRKAFNDIYWNATPYQVKVGTAIGCPVISTKQLALTNWVYDKVNGTAITDGKPTYVSTNDVYRIKRRRDDHFTLSFMNEIMSATTAAPSFTKKIGGFRISIYNGNTSLYDDWIDNTEANGGGPSNIISGTTAVSAPFDIITFGCGKQNSLFDTYTTATHYYVSSWLPTGSGCPAVGTPARFANSPISEIYRIDIVEDECNDFEPVQVSWLNEFGFRDYFYFQKRLDYKIDINRQTYQKILGNWSGDIFKIESWERGEGRVFREDLQEKYTINTRYVSEDEAKFLKNLFISPDVRVRFNGSTTWNSVVLQDTTWEQKTIRKNKLFQYTLNFNMANKLNIQNG